MYLVQIKDVDPVRFTILLALIFFGMIARLAAEGDPSKDVFRSMQLKTYINNKFLNPRVKILAMKNIF